MAYEVQSPSVAISWVLTDTSKTPIEEFDGMNGGKRHACILS